MEKAEVGEIVLSNDPWAECAACFSFGYHHRQTQLSIGEMVYVVANVACSIEVCRFCNGYGVLPRPEFLQACVLSEATFPKHPPSRFPNIKGYVVRTPFVGKDGDYLVEIDMFERGHLFKVHPCHHVTIRSSRNSS